MSVIFLVNKNIFVMWTACAHNIYLCVHLLLLLLFVDGPVPWACNAGLPGRRAWKRHQSGGLRRRSIRFLFKLGSELMFMLGVLMSLFFPTSNFLSHTRWTDKEKNDRRRDGQLHNIHAGEIPGWGNLDFYFILFPPIGRYLDRSATVLVGIFFFHCFADRSVIPSALHWPGPEDLQLCPGEGDGLQVKPHQHI